MKKIYLITIFAFFISYSKAQINYNFNGLDGSPTSASVPTGYSASSLTANNTDKTADFFTATSVSDTYAGRSAGGNITTFARIGSGGIGVNALSYFELTITPSTGYVVNVTTIGFGSRSISGSGGPAAVVIRSSVNNYSMAIDSFAINSSAVWTLYNRTLISPLIGLNNTPVTLRIYARNGSGSTTANNWRLDDLNIGLISTLPLTWLDFNAKKEADGSAKLSWTVSEQVNTQSFEIERLNAKGEFVAIGSKASTNQKSITLYSFIDKNPLSGDNYYRIKQIDQDGKFTYSKICHVNLSLKGEDWFVYPNPVISDKTNLLINKNIEFLNYKLVDRAGRVILEKRETKLESGTQLFINHGVLAKGIYVLQVATSNGSGFTKLIVD
jgi:hypothetical protein